MSTVIKILGVHGLGDHRNTSWEHDWEQAVRRVFPGQTDGNLEFSFVNYDAIFAATDISGWETMRAVWKLGRSAVGSAFQRRRGAIGDISDRVKWTAGYVVAWVEDEGFQRRTRKLVLDRIASEKPDIVLAHSLGSLITYNAFSHDDAHKTDVATALKRTRYVTLGSQLGNPFVIRNLTPGRIEPLSVRQWYHLYNEEDDVFTAPIKLWDSDRFTQIDTRFDIDGFADHSAVAYLGHGNTVASVWQPLAAEHLDSRAAVARPASRRRRSRAPERIKRRALLIGINAYPREADRLEGCVNDVFLMSSVLQECGFPAESIRTCLDERATAKGIIERMEWLLDDPRPGDERVFYYSGHGATIPQYGEDNEPDRHTETLVPWDFDWSPETAVTDDRIFELYSQLPFDTRLAMIFDCCHSGGMHRDGGARARGIDPPDDIRHRSIKWDAETEMWVPRDFERLNGKFSREKSALRAFFGADGATTRLGRASLIRGQSEAQYRAMKKKRDTNEFGPYLPLIIEACDESEFSYEYRHGVTSYGAFTYALASRLRRYQRITFERLINETREQLAELGYAQAPQILGPATVTQALVPWLRN